MSHYSNTCLDTVSYVFLHLSVLSVPIDIIECSSDEEDAPVIEFATTAVQATTSSMDAAIQFSPKMEDTASQAVSRTFDVGLQAAYSESNIAIQTENTGCSKNSKTVCIGTDQELSKNCHQRGKSRWQKI